MSEGCRNHGFRHFKTTRPEKLQNVVALSPLLWQGLKDGGLTDDNAFNEEKGMPAYMREALQEDRREQLLEFFKQHGGVPHDESLYGGTLARCRNIKWIFSHAGGALPFLAERIARLSMRPEYKEKVPNGVLPELKRLYYDTALSANWLAFRSLFELVTPDKVLFGSDYPFAPEATLAATVKGLIDMNFGDDVLSGIEREHALKLFPQFG